MKKVYSLRVYKKEDGHTINYGRFLDVKEVMKLGVLALRGGAFESLKDKKQVLQAIEDWTKIESIELKDGWMNIDEDYVYDTMEEYLGK